MGTTLSITLSTALLGAIISGVVLLRKLRTCHILPSLPGPPSTSWLAGSMPTFIHAENVGDADHALVDRYGLAFQMKGSLNSNVLYLADPKALQYVLNTCGYMFYKDTFLLRLITGPGLIGVEGSDHARQRKILMPGFSHTAMKEFVPMFIQTAQKAAGQWRDLVQEDGQSLMIDMHTWLSRITLDSIGKAAFSYNFGALDDDGSGLLKAYRNVFMKMFHKLSDAQIALIGLLGALPNWMARVLRMLPVQAMKRLAAFTDLANKVALDIIQRETRALETGVPLGKDIMSILVRANRSEDPKNRLNDEELLSQMTSLMFAGLDTTTSLLVWIFYELARHPDAQTKIREEIKTVRAASGDNELGITEFEAMPYTIAVIKETLRFYPIAPHNVRTAATEGVIPLSSPIKSSSGEEITAIPVRAGQKVFMSLWAYNRIKSLWGEDADLWRPERFLGSEPLNRPKGSIGVYANLATFSSGVHSCIGWRLAVLELQAILIALIENFEISPPPSDLDITIIRASAPTLTALVKGQESRGAQMPLCISAIN